MSASTKNEKQALGLFQRVATHLLQSVIYRQDIQLLKLTLVALMGTVGANPDHGDNPVVKALNAALELDGEAWLSRSPDGVETWAWAEEVEVWATDTHVLHYTQNDVLCCWGVRRREVSA